MRSFWLIPNGLGHFLFIDLIPCLTRILLFHVALPRTEIISVIYISSVLILVGCFGGGGGWGWMEVLLHEPWLETPCSPVRFLQQSSLQHRTRKVNAGTTLRGAGWSQQFHLWVSMWKSWCVWDGWLNVHTQVDHKFHLPFWFYHLFFFHPAI